LIRFSYPNDDVKGGDYRKQKYEEKHGNRIGDLD
jgi:hypothetical protein